MEITITDTEQSLQQAAQTFVENMAGNHIFAFYGSMGAGKTTFIKAVCEHMGVEDVVTSPTFAIVNEYTDRHNNTIYHFDFYRIEKLEEVYDMGYEDYFYSGKVCFLEWPELIEDILPNDTIRVTITEQGDGTRTIAF